LQLHHQAQLASPKGAASSHRQIPSSDNEVNGTLGLLQGGIAQACQRTFNTKRKGTIEQHHQDQRATKSFWNSPG
jgi:hypothetical protein